jgi:hypothetical protein
MSYFIQIVANMAPIPYNNKVQVISVLCKEVNVKVRGGKAPYAGNALKVMPIVPSPATFYDHERP